jgi:hypothetical protein
MAGRAGEDRGVKVERPEPKARTYDLDAMVERRRLPVTTSGSAQVVGRRGAGVRIGFLGVEVAEVGSSVARHLFVPLSGSMMR